MAFFNHAVQNLLAKTGAAGISFMATLCLPALIGMDHFGIYAYLVVCIGFIIPVSSFGFGSGIIYLLSTRLFEVEQTSLAQLVMASLFGILNILLLLFVNQLGWLGSAFHSLSVMEWILFLSACWMQTVSFFIGRTFFGLSSFTALNIIELTSSLLQPMLVLACMWIWGAEHPYYIFLAQWLLALILLILHLFILLQFPFQWYFDKLFIQKAMHYGLKSWIGDIALKANLRLDQMILGAVSTSTHIGLYNIAVKLSEIIWFFPDAMGPVLFNKLAGLRSDELKIDWLARIHRITFFICALGSLLWVLLVYFVMAPLFFKGTSDWLIDAFILLMPGTLGVVSSKVLTKLYSSSGKVLWTSYISLVGSLISLSLCFWLIPWYSVVGAAVASTLSYICMSIAAWWILARNYEVKWHDFIQPRIEDFKWLAGQMKSFNFTK